MASTSTPGAQGTASAGGSEAASARDDRFFELSLDLVCVASFDGYLTRVNEAWTRLLGWTAEELGEVPYIERIHPDDQKRTIDEATRLAQSGGGTRDFELRFQARDGRWVWLLFSAQAAPDEQALYAVAKDITERKRAENALREAEQRFRSAFDNAPIGMALTGLDGRFIQANRALSQITGRTVEELTGMPVRDITHPDDSAADTEAMRATTAGEMDTFTQEKRYLRPDGQAVWVDLSVALMRDAAGEPLYFISQMEDIDERRAAKQALVESEQRFRAVTQSVNDAVISADSDGRIVFWSESAQAIFAHSREEALGQPLTLLMPARYREAHEQGFARVQAGGEPHVLGKSTVALEGLRKDGSEFPIELSLGEWRVDGRAFYTGVVRDVSERRQAERYLAAQHAVARALVEHQHVERALPLLLAAIGENMEWEVGCFWALEPAGKRLKCHGFWSSDPARTAGFETMTREIRFDRGRGLPGRVWEQGSPAWVLDVTEDENISRAKVARDAGLHGAIGLPVVDEGEVVAVVEFFSSALRHPGQELLEMMTTISRQLGQSLRRRHAELELAGTAVQLQSRNAELERSNAELEQFAYVASHDLSEPLRMVSGFVQLLQTRYEGRLDDDADEFIAYTVDGVNRMQELINDLLAYSRIGRSEREDGPVDFNSVFAAIRASLAAAIADSGVEIEAEPLPVVRGEHRELAQLMQNLLSNAIKFSDAEEPRVQVGARRDGDFWELHVTDNGIGIELRHAERIFKMFQRLHRRDEYPGTGIGLAICKKIVDRAGGRIWVEQVPGGGSAFRFTLPSLEDEAR